MCRRQLLIFPDIIFQPAHGNWNVEHDKSGSYNFPMDHNTQEYFLNDLTNMEMSHSDEYIFYQLNNIFQVSHLELGLSSKLSWVILGIFIFNSSCHPVKYT